MSPEREEPVYVYLFRGDSRFFFNFYVHTVMLSFIISSTLLFTVRSEGATTGVGTPTGPRIPASPGNIPPSPLGTTSSQESQGTHTRAHTHTHTLHYQHLLMSLTQDLVLQPVLVILNQDHSHLHLVRVNTNI